MIDNKEPSAPTMPFIELVKPKIEADTEQFVIDLLRRRSETEPNDTSDSPNED